MKVAINGLGRMGRCLFRALYGQKNIEISAINCTMSPEACAYFIKWDSTHGQLPHDVSFGSNWISINGGGQIPVTNTLDLKNLKWTDIDVVAECSGKFKKPDILELHIEAGAKRVLLSSPFDSNAKISDATRAKTIIYGVNHLALNQEDHIISAASCTSNALLPLIDVLHRSFGVNSGFFLTVHAYTNDQNILDANHKDLRRARSAAVSMIPTTTGSSQAIADIFPALDGKIQGRSIRVPVPNVSLVDFTFCTEKKIDAATLNSAFQNAGNGVTDITNDRLVSVDFVGNPSSSIVDMGETTVITPNQARIMAWYDNEWGFVSRMVDILHYIEQKWH